MRLNKIVVLEDKKDMSCDNALSLTPHFNNLSFCRQFLVRISFVLNIFYSGRKYTEKDWVQLKVRHYPLEKGGRRNIEEV